MKVFHIVKHETIYTVPTQEEADKACQELIDDDPENDYVVVEGWE